MVPSREGNRGAPIARHRAFPWMVAAWFAALLGLAMLVLPVALFEAVSVALGLPALVPAAAPPLGTTAKLLIALLAAAGGALLGLWIARRIAATTDGDAAASNAAVTEPVMREPAPAPGGVAMAPKPKPPIAARDELGSDSFDSPLPATGEAETETSWAVTPPDADDREDEIAAPAPEHSPLLDKPLDELSLAELVGRFSHALETRRNPAAPPEPIEAPLPRPDRAEDGYDALVALSRPAAGTPHPADRNGRAAGFETRDEPRNEPRRADALRHALDRLGRVSGAA